MALVAYSDDSDLGTDSDDGDEAPGNVVVKAGVGERSTESGGRVSPARLASGVDSIVDEDDDTLGSVKPSSTLFSNVPAAVPISNLLGPGQEEEDEVVDVPTVDTWKVTQELKKQAKEVVGGPQPGTQHVTAHRKERKKVKIFAPSLSEFADDDDEEEMERKEPPKKKLNPSSHGSGLFAVLPEPKHVSAKEAGRSLVPHVLTKRPPKPQKPQRKVQKAAAATSTTTAAGHVSDEDEDEAPTGTSDFFSLSEPSAVHAKAAGGLAVSQVSTAAAPIVEPIREVSRVSNNQPEEPPPVLEQHYQEAIPGEDPTNMIPFASQPEAATAAEGDIDEAIMLRLAGKRGRAEAINFIDVNADDALLTRHEWMTKALSEEKPQHGFSRKREGLPTQKQKQKHQITYLAHQARERELDLKNTWAQNKMTKMQSQAKYGF